MKDVPRGGWAGSGRQFCWLLTLFLDSEELLQAVTFCSDRCHLLSKVDPSRPIGDAEALLRAVVLKL